MDPLEKLDLPWDTSLCLLRELDRRGHSNFLILPASLSLEAGRLRAAGQRLRPAGLHRYDLGPQKKVALRDFDLVLIRKDPPFDKNYLALTYLLEASREKITFVNHPRGIRNANEKVTALRFLRWCPPTLVSASPERLAAFHRRLRSDTVLKPLDEKGGTGVTRLKKNQRGLPTLLKKRTQGGRETLLLQKFIPVPEGKGDKRILLWKGKILGGFAKIPKPGEFRSNILLGARFEACPITDGEKALVKEMRSLLLKEGLYFVGIDVREEKLMEVNVTSPAGLVELDLLYGGATEALAGQLLNSACSRRGRGPLP